MSGVKRYDLQQTGLRTGSGDPLPKSVVAECDYDALAQRCRELEDYIDNHSAITADYIARLQRTFDERDALRAVCLDL